MRLNFPATALLATLVAGGAFADDPVRENSRGARSSRIFRGPGMDETGRLAMRLTRLEQRLAHADRTIRVLRRRINRLESNPVLELGPFVSIESADLNERSGPHVLLTGVNLHVRSGSGFTDDEGQLRELGNVIVGYNERRRGVCSSTGSGLTIVQRCAADEECRGGDCVFGENARQGSHNLVIGPEHFYPSFGGLVAGRENTVEGEHSSVVGGQENEQRSEAEDSTQVVDSEARCVGAPSIFLTASRQRFLGGIRTKRQAVRPRSLGVGKIMPLISLLSSWAGRIMLPTSGSKSSLGDGLFSSRPSSRCCHRLTRLIARSSRHRS